jgi:hypothetical protein
MLNDSRAADRRHADLNVTRDLRLLAEVGHDAGNPHMKAVPAREDALALGDRFGRLFVLLILGGSLGDRQEGRAQQRQGRNDCSSPETNSGACKHREDSLP